MEETVLMQLLQKAQLKEEDMEEVVEDTGKVLMEVVEAVVEEVTIQKEEIA